MNNALIRLTHNNWDVVNLHTSVGSGYAIRRMDALVDAGWLISGAQPHRAGRAETRGVRLKLVTLDETLRVRMTVEAGVFALTEAWIEDKASKA